MLRLHFSPLVSLAVTRLCNHGISLVIEWISSCIFTSGIEPRISREFAASISPMSVPSYYQVDVCLCQWLNIRDLNSETECQELNARDWMSETQCQRLNARDSMSETQCQTFNVRVGFTNRVIHHSFAQHLSEKYVISIRRDSGFVALCFPSFDCCMAFSKCGPATHSIYVLGNLLQYKGIDFYSPIQNGS